ncbi:hypothetical protein [Aquimarina litoralis]|uniref:hypothetical protein n=1 Tax=Aquimarina litoralis TaxID=584605 RepID=UPI001C57BD21|nr:hypothetical protein [Aquimarina litoralis]MBW1296453.1 hypothetical protein [Aquimarina litoralis]
MKYEITEEDLKKRSYGVSFDFLNQELILLIQKEKERNNPFLSDIHIQKLEKQILKGINSKIYTFFIFGIISFIYGLFILLTFEPRVAINLYTQFPLIENGSIPIVLGVGLIIGCYYSYTKRKSVLTFKVKTKIIEHFRELRKEKTFTETNKGKGSNKQPKRNKRRKK